jgi:hypothetical protein
VSRLFLYGRWRSAAGSSGSGPGRAGGSDGEFLNATTMLPHELTMTKTVNLGMSAPGMPSISSR